MGLRNSLESGSPRILNAIEPGESDTNSSASEILRNGGLPSWQAGGGVLRRAGAPLLRGH